MITDVLNRILDVCCAEFDVTKEVALSKSQKKDLVVLRKIFVVVAKNEIKNIPNEKLCKFLNKTNSQIDNMLKKTETDTYYDYMLDCIRNNLK